MQFGRRGQYSKEFMKMKSAASTITPSSGNLAERADGTEILAGLTRNSEFIASYSLQLRKWVRRFRTGQPRAYPYHE
jgi:hypothetical protein